MFSRLLCWPVWLLVLLIGSWLSMAQTEAAQETPSNNESSVGTISFDELHFFETINTFPDENLDDSTGKKEPEEEPTATDGDPGDTSASSRDSIIVPALSLNLRVPALVQQWLEHYAGAPPSSKAPDQEAVEPYLLGGRTEDMLSKAAPPVTAPTTAVGPVEPLEPPPTSHLTIMLDWYPSPRHAALLVAQERELFAKHGLKVDILTPADPEVPTKMLAAGRIDLALTRQPLLHLLVNDDKPIIRIATLIRLPLSFLLVSDAENLDSLAELEGARIGHLDQDGERVLLAALLASQDLTRDQVDSPKVHFRVEEAMHEGQVDAIIGAMQHQLPEVLANDGLSTQKYRIEDFGVPLHDGLIIVANRDRLGKKRDAIRHFVDALEEATVWITNNSDASWSMLVDVEPGMDTVVNQRAWPDVRGLLSLSPAALSQGRYINFERYLLDADIIESLTPVQRLAVDLGSETPH